jgi:hypothetical protein
MAKLNHQQDQAFKEQLDCYAQNMEDLCLSRDAGPDHFEHLEPQKAALEQMF